MNWTAAALAVLAVVVPSGHLPVSAAAELPTCVVTSVQLATTDYGGGGVALSATSGRQECFGSYVFVGVHVRRAGYPPLTRGNYRELALVLRGWRSEDGVPAVDQWVRWSFAVRVGMRAAGLQPTQLLQWIDGSAAEAASGSAKLWPTFLPRGRMVDPAAAVRVATRRVPVQSPGSKPVAVRFAGRIWPTDAPPRSVQLDHRVVPCSVLPACRTQVLGYERWRDASPWKRRVVLWASRWPWVTGTLGLFMAIVAVLRMHALRRRNLRWYGRVRPPA